MTNPFQEGENDAIQNLTQQLKDPLRMPSGPVTRFRAKRFKEALNGLIHQQEEMIHASYNMGLRHFDEELITIIKAFEVPNEGSVSLGKMELNEDLI